MKNGRFLPFEFNIMSFIMSLCVRSLDEDAGGVDASDGMDTLFGEEPTISDNPSNTGTADSTISNSETSNSDDSNAQTEPPQGQSPEVSDDDITARLGAQESSETKMTRLERENKASAVEGKRFSSERKAIDAALEAQGLKLSVTDGKVNLIPNDKYGKDATSLSVKVSDLSASQQEALESGDLDQAQDVLNSILAKAKDAFVRAQPTLEKEPSRISDAQRESTYQGMESAVDVNNQPLHPQLSANKQHIDNLVNGPIAGDAVKAAFAENPEFMAMVMNNHINAVRATLAAEKSAAKSANDKKQSEAQSTTDVNVDNGGSVTVKGSAEDVFLSTL